MAAVGGSHRGGGATEGGSDVRVMKLVGRRNVLAIALFVVVLLVVAASPRLLGRDLGNAVEGIRRARPLDLWLAAAAFLACTFCTIFSWRASMALCGSQISRTDCGARYGVGSLVNALSPARIGEAVRIALLARTLEGEDRVWRMGGVVGALAAVRALVFSGLVVCCWAVGAMPLWPVFALIGIAGAAVAVAWFTRGRTPHSHVAHLLDAFRALGRDPRQGIRMAGWIAGVQCFRILAATAIGAALGIRSPLMAALIIVPALDLAGLVPLSGNLGVTSGTVAMALQTRGVDLTKALAAGIAFHAVETAVGLSFGLAGGLLVTRFRSPVVRRWTVIAAGAGAAVCVGAAFGATALPALL